MEALVSAGIILHKLTDGKTKVLAIVVPGKETARRVDFLYTPPNEYAFAVLYFTGSKVFNTVMRQRALNMGYTLNEHGIYKLVGGKREPRVDDEFPNEKSIFDFLKMKYKNPEEKEKMPEQFRPLGTPQSPSRLSLLLLPLSLRKLPRLRRRHHHLCKLMRDFTKSGVLC